MENKPKPRSIAPALSGGAIVESRLATRGLELLSSLEFTGIVPAAILIHHNRLLVIEDASIKIDWDHKLIEWNEEIPRILALHYFGLDTLEYCCTSFTELIRIPMQVSTQSFAIMDDYLVVTETYELDSTSSSTSTELDWVEQILKTNGEFVTVLTDNQVLLHLFQQQNAKTIALKVSDPRYKLWIGITGDRFIGLRELHNEIHEHYENFNQDDWESERFVNAFDILDRLDEDPTPSEVTLIAHPKSYLEYLLTDVYPEEPHWNISPSGFVTVFKGGHTLSDDFENVLLANEAQEYRFAGLTQAGDEALINWVKPTSVWNPVYFTYCWIEKQQLRAIHRLSFRDCVALLNRSGKVKYTFRHQLFESMINSRTVYFICDEEYSKTSVIMAFDVRTSAMTPIVPKVPRHMSIMHRHA